MATTITEALAEIKTIGKRLEKKRESVKAYLARDSRVKDPLEKEGGSTEYVRKERQAISDLEKRVVTIRTAIAKSNLGTAVTIQGMSKTVFELLTWRREVSEAQKNFVTGMRMGISSLREKMMKDGKRVVGSDGEAETNRGDAVISVNEKELIEESEKIETVLGELDGKLSLLNATTIVDV